ncbi:MAG: hypothetical protein AAGI09_11985 [Pseudomonadota bacterium]
MSKPWEKRYIEHVMNVTGKTLSAIARDAKISSTTLTRPMNDPDHKFTLKMTTLHRVAESTGIPLAGFQPTGTPEDETSGFNEGKSPQIDMSHIPPANPELMEHVEAPKNTLDQKVNALQCALVGDYVQVAGTYDVDGIDELIETLEFARKRLRRRRDDSAGK